MIREFYGLARDPFRVTPDSLAFYESRTHREALASLVYGIEAGRGFLALIAKPGMGKTTLLFRLLEQLQTSSRTAFLFQTQCNSRELLRYLLMDWGCPTSGQEFVVMHSQLNEALTKGALDGKRSVLILDEAQNLDDSVLETLRLLSDFETPQDKLLQIVLAGQPQLAEKLLRPNLAQLRQRIAMVGRLEPFSREEVVRYIEDRLQIAGHVGEPLFTGRALEMITLHSQGIPRNINNLCFNALSLGCALGRKRIDSEIVREVIADLDLTPLIPDATQPVSVGAPTAVPSPIPMRREPSAFRKHALRVGALTASFVAAALMPLSTSKGDGGRIAGESTATAVAPAAQLVSADSEVPTPPPPAAIPAASGSALPASLVENSANEHRGSEYRPSETFTIVVEPNQTLYGISQSYFGRFDPALAEQIAALNPKLKGPNGLQAGKPLRLPIAGRRPEQTSQSLGRGSQGRRAQR